MPTDPPGDYSTEPGKHYGDFSIDWQGDQVRSAFAESAREAIDETMGLCVTDAQKNVPYRTGTLQRSIKPSKAKIAEDEVYGVWGSFDVVYALVVETGAYKDPEFLAQRKQPKRRQSHAKQRATEGRDRKRTPGIRRNTGNTHFLRNAADSYYPGLAERIAKRYDARRL